MKSIGPKDKEFLNIITASPDGRQSHSSCIVKAHGTQRPGKTFRMDGGELWFYCPEGAILAGNFYKFLRGDIEDKWVQKYTNSDTVPDLSLCKSIDRHQSGGSSFEIGVTLANYPDYGESQSFTNYEYLQKLCTDGVCKYDLVSVRNRSIFVRWSTVTLHEVYLALKKAGYGFGIIHCYMCRSPNDKARQWNLHTKTWIS
jgi:hypothetical protein